MHPVIKSFLTEASVMMPTEDGVRTGARVRVKRGKFQGLTGTVKVVRADAAVVKLDPKHVPIGIGMTDQVVVAPTDLELQ